MFDEFAPLSSRLIAVTRQSFPDLGSYPAELQVVAAAATPKDDSVDWRSPANDPDPASSQKWGRDREIRAKFIRWLCLDKAARQWIDPSGVSVVGAKITGALNLDFGDIPFPVSLRSCWFENRPSFWGTTFATLDLSRSWVPGINAPLVSTKKSLFLKAGFHSTDTVILTAAQVGGYLEMQEGTFEASNGSAVMAEGIRVDGNVLAGSGTELNNGKSTSFDAHGAVNLFGARIGGDLDCSGGRFQCPKGTALRLGGSVVKGNLMLAGRFDGDQYSGLVLEGFTDLRSCSVDTLFLEPNDKEWPSTGNLLLDGFTYDRLIFNTGNGSEADIAQKMLAWLARDNSATLQPYRQLAKVLSNYGDTRGAKAALMAIEGKLSARNDLLPWRLMKRSIGYGYQPENAFFYTGGIVALGSLLYLRTRRSRGMIPTDQEAARCFVKDGSLPDEYPRFNPLIFSIENTLPIVKLGQTDKWQAAAVQLPAAHKKLPSRTARMRAWTPSGRFLQWLIWIQIALGWLLATLFVAAVGGLVRHE